MVRLVTVQGGPLEHRTHHSKEEIAERLLEWWQYSRRRFPWRETVNPYEILVAELLLRKTTAKQVEMLYKKFLSRYPSPKALSEASEKELAESIRSLGMEHRRAILLRQIGKEIVDKYSGRVPISGEELVTLPGVGHYVANAILCLAGGKDVPLVDTNAIRVFQRVSGFESRKRRPRDDSMLWSSIQHMIPPRKGKDFNLALIDLAHIVCIPKNPHCSACPLNRLCRYRHAMDSDPRARAIRLRTYPRSKKEYNGG